MKTRLLSLFTLLLALTCAFAAIPAVSAAEYEKTENYTIPFDKMSSHENSLKLTQETVSGTDNPALDGKSVVKITKNTEAGAGQWCYLHFGEYNNSLNVRLDDYKYLVVKVYYELDKFALGGGNNLPLFHRSTDANAATEANPSGSALSYFKAKELKDDGTMVQHGVRQDNWLYLIYDLSVVDAFAKYEDTTAYPNGKNDVLQSTWFYPFANGAAGVDNPNMGNDTCYLQFATFTNDAAGLISADKIADMPKYQKTENYTVPFDYMNAVTPDLLLTAETIEGTDNPALDGKSVMTLSKAPDVSAPHNWYGVNFGSTTDAAKSLNVKLTDYKYLVVKVYYELDKFTIGGGNNIPLYHRSTAANPGEQFLSYFKAQELKDDGSMAQHGVRQDNWLYLVYDLSAPVMNPYTDTAKYPNGMDDTLNATMFYPFCNGAGGTSYAEMGNDVCYLQFATFTNDASALIAADKKAEEEETEPVTEPVTEPATEPATEAATKAPAATTDNTTEEEKGCASSAAFGVVAILAVAATGTLVVKKKKND